jgi:hypothetical protein
MPLPSGRWPTRLAWFLWVLSLALTMGGFVLALFMKSVDVDYEFTPGVFLLPGQLAWSTVGALVARRHPTHPIGWLFCLYAVGMGLALFADPYGRYALLAPSSPLPAGGLMLWLAPKGGALALACATFALLLFPTGRLPSLRWPVRQRASLMSQMAERGHTLRPVRSCRTPTLARQTVPSGGVAITQR